MRFARGGACYDLWRHQSEIAITSGAIRFFQGVHPWRGDVIQCHSHNQNRNPGDWFMCRRSMSSEQHCTRNTVICKVASTLIAQVCVVLQHAWQSHHLDDSSSRSCDADVGSWLAVGRRRRWDETSEYIHHVLFVYQEKCCVGNMPRLLSYTCVSYTVKWEDPSGTEQSSREAHNFWTKFSVFEVILLLGVERTEISNCYVSK